MALGLACYSPPAMHAEPQCPTDDEDTACEVCVKQNCCAELTACQDDPDCDCLSECVGQMGPGQEDFCLGSCDLDTPPAMYDALAECASSADCTAACE